MNAMLRAQQEVFDIMPDSKIGVEMAEAFEEAGPVAYRARHSEQENWHYYDHAVGWWECQPLYAGEDTDPNWMENAVAFRCMRSSDEWSYYGTLSGAMGHSRHAAVPVQPLYSKPRSDQ